MPKPRPTAPGPPAAAPLAVRPVAHVPHLHPQAANTAPSNALVPGPAASGAVANQGTGNGRDDPGGPGVALASSEPVATPTPTPKPACAQPHVEAHVTRAIEPDYPESVREQNITGTTKVRVWLSETGAVLDARVYESSGTRALDDSALVAAKRSTYAPEIDDCTREAGSYIFRAEFSAQ